jgi:hypothetical protein
MASRQADPSIIRAFPFILQELFPNGIDNRHITPAQDGARRAKTKESKLFIRRNGFKAVENGCQGHCSSSWAEPEASNERSRFRLSIAMLLSLAGGSQ